MVLKPSTTTMPSSSSANDQDHHNSTLPVPNPTQSYWRTPPHPLDSLRSTPSLPTTCDILIIGAGLAGVSTLYHLLGEHTSSPAAAASPPPSILLLDARQACSGATGRNGGHVSAPPSTSTSHQEVPKATDACRIASRSKSSPSRSSA